jgi:hypothetical protein
MQTRLNLALATELTGMIVPLANQLHDFAPIIGFRSASLSQTRIHAFTAAILAAPFANLVDRRLIIFAANLASEGDMNLFFALAISDAFAAAIGLRAFDNMGERPPILLSAKRTSQKSGFALSQSGTRALQRTVLSHLCFTWQIFKRLAAVLTDNYRSFDLPYVHTGQRAISFSFSATRVNSNFFAAHFAWLDDTLFERFGGAWFRAVRLRASLGLEFLMTDRARFHVNLQ